MRALDLFPIVAVDPNFAIPEWLWGVLAIVGVFALLLGPTFAACLLERLLVWPYTPLDPFAAGQVGPSTRVAPTRVDDATARSAIPDPSGDRNLYRPPAAPGAVASSRLTADAARANTWFRENGFAPLGSFAHAKGGIYKIRFDFWLTSDRQILGLVAGGTMAGIPYETTTLYSRLADGRALVTLNDQKASSNDLPTRFVEALVPTPLMRELTDFHRRRIAEIGVSLLTYDATRPLADHLRMRADKADQLEALGVARFVDLDRTAYKYTLWGAIRRTLGSYLNGMRRVFVPDSVVARFRRRQPDRIA